MTSENEDIIELSEEEAEDYVGDKCIKLNGIIIHKKGCKHNNLTLTKEEIDEMRDYARVILGAKDIIVEDNGIRFIY